MEKTTGRIKLDREIVKVQNSTRTLFKFMVPIHERLRMKFPSYYKWHTNPHAGKVHASIALIMAVIAIVSIFSFIPNKTEASEYATHFKITAPVQATVGTGFQITITALDDSEVVDTSFSGIPELSGLVSSPGGNAPTYENVIFTNGVAHVTVTGYAKGSQTITALFGLVSGSSNEVTFFSLSTTQVGIDPSSTQNITSGQAVNFSAEPKDNYGNTTSDLLTWSGTASADSGTFNKTAVGSYTVFATANLIESAHVAVNVTSGSSYNPNLFRSSILLGGSSLIPDGGSAPSDGETPSEEGTPTPTPTAPPPSETKNDCNYVTLSRSKIGTFANHIVHFESLNGIGEGETIQVNYPSDFDTTDVDYTDIDMQVDYVDVDLAVSPSGSTWGAVFGGTGNRTLTITSGTGTVPVGKSVEIEIGTNATHQHTGDKQIKNPTTSKSYIINVIDDIYNLPVYISTEDQITTHAETESTIYFDVTQPSAALGTMDFMHLTTPKTATMEAGTNAPSGYSITALGDTLKSGSNSIPAGATPFTPTAGVSKFGLRIAASGGLGTPTSPYNTSQYAQTFTSTAWEQVAGSTLNSDLTIFTIFYTANISPSQNAGDYSATHTYICTGNF